MVGSKLVGDGGHGQVYACCKVGELTENDEYELRKAEDLSRSVSTFQQIRREYVARYARMPQHRRSHPSPMFPASVLS